MSEFDLAVSLPIIKQGWLYKQGGTRKNWKRRWFIVTRRDNGPPYRPPFLTYYETENNTKTPLGIVNLDLCTRCEQVDYHKQHGGCSLCFEIEVPGRTYRMLTNTEDDMMDWIALVYKLARRLKRDGSQDSSASQEPVQEQVAAFPQPANTIAFAASTHCSFGYLTKEGNSIKTWKRRWFVLQGQTVSYYRDKGVLPVLGVIKLNGATVVEHNDPARPNCFKVITEARTYMMFADNAEQQQKWIKALSLASAEVPIAAPMGAAIVRTRSEAIRPAGMRTSTVPANAPATLAEEEDDSKADAMDTSGGGSESTSTSTTAATSTSTTASSTAAAAAAAAAVAAAAAAAADAAADAATVTAKSSESPRSRSGSHSSVGSGNGIGIGVGIGVGLGGAAPFEDGKEAYDEMEEGRSDEETPTPTATTAAEAAAKRRSVHNEDVPMGDS